MNIYMNICIKDICVCMHTKSLHLCLTLCNALGCSLPGSSVHGIPQARILEWVAVPFLQDIFPTQQFNQCLLRLPLLADVFFSMSAIWQVPLNPAPAALPARSQPQWRPREHNWDRPPPKAIWISTPAARVYLSRVRSRRVFSLSVHLWEHNWEARPHPRQKPTPAPRRPRSPRPCTVQVPSQLLAFTPG